MTDLAFDSTAVLSANFIPPEFHDVSLAKNRFFIPARGMFFEEGMVIRNFTNNVLLRPILDYQLYEIDRDVSLSTGHNAFKIIHVNNPDIVAVSVAYHAVGGDYQYTSSQLADELDAYITGTDDQYPWGHVIKRPIAYAPELHLQDADSIYDAQRMVLAVAHIGDAISSGDHMATGQIFQYIDQVAQGYVDEASLQINALSDRVTRLVNAEVADVGKFIITDNPQNPAIRRGIGQYVLNPNILLYGSALGDTIGQLIPLATGSGVNARRTYIWQQVADIGQISYSLSASAVSINEGSSVTITLATTGIPSGSTVAYKITGTAVFSAADIAPTPINGNFTVGSGGIASLTITAVNDLTTEGPQVFTVALVAVPTVKVNVTINDTSLSPSVTMRWSGNSNGVGGTSTSVNEGSSIYLVLTGVNMPVNTVCTLDYSLGNSPNTDYTANRPTSVTFDTNVKIIPFTVVADRITEGNKTMAVGLTSTYITTPIVASITIVDTSIAPTYNLYFSGVNTGSGTITSINEGSTAYLVVSTTNVDPGTVLQLTYTGDVDANDFTAVRPTTATIDAQGKAIIPYALVADSLTEGTQTFGVVLSDSGNQLQTTSITVIDTSIDPAYAIKFTVASDGSGANVTTRNEGGSIYLSLFASSTAPGTVFNITYGGGITQADLSTTLPTTLTIGANGRATALLTFLNDYITEGAQDLVVLASISSVQVAAGTITVVDTSTSPIYNYAWSSSTSGTPTVNNVNEGATVYLVFSVTNPVPGMVLQVPLANNNTVVPGQFATTPPTTVAINGAGYGYVAYTFANDQLTDGAKVLAVNPTYGGNSVFVTNPAITVNDTSTLPVTASFTSDFTTPITAVNEGGGGYLMITSPALKRGGTYSLYFTGMSDASKFQVTTRNSGGVATPVNSFGPFTISTGNFVINTATGTMQVPFSVLPDSLTTGARTLTALVTVTDTNSTTASATDTLTINDTSTAPAYTMYYATTAAGTTPITIANVNTSCYLIVKSSTAPNGTVVAVTFDKSLMTSTYSNPPANVNVTINGGIGSVLINLAVT